MLRNNIGFHQSRGWQWSTVYSEVINSAALCGIRYRTGKIKGTESRNYLSIIELIKESYIFPGSPVSAVKILLKQSGASDYNNSMISIHF